MSIFLALQDALNNCQRHHAKCTLTLKSGTQYTGMLVKPTGGTFHDATDLMLRLPNSKGWVVMKMTELIAVESHR